MTRTRVGKRKKIRVRVYVYFLLFCCVLFIVLFVCCVCVVVVVFVVAQKIEHTINILSHSLNTTLSSSLSLLLLLPRSSAAVSLAYNISPFLKETDRILSGDLEMPFLNCSRVKSKFWETFFLDFFLSLKNQNLKYERNISKYFSINTTST